jgi:hypothetical protein
MLVLLTLLRTFSKLKKGYSKMYVLLSENMKCEKFPYGSLP